MAEGLVGLYIQIGRRRQKPETLLEGGGKIGGIRGEVAREEGAQGLELDQRIDLFRVKEKIGCLRQVPGTELVDLTLHEGAMWPQRSPPLLRLGLELPGGSVGMALGAGAGDAQVCVEDGSWDGDGMVRAGERDGSPHLRMLEVGHVTRHASASVRVRWVERVRRGIGQLRRVA